MIKIGKHSLPGRAVLAPMAGITDWPFRTLCREFGAAMVTGEMTTGAAELKHTFKSQSRTAQSALQMGEKEPIVVQIAGTSPEQLADFAEHHESLGAQIIDINMGCPAKKVCKKLAGSSLLRNEKLVADILTTVVKRVDAPVTLKIRTGWSPDQRNATSIARIAEDAGIQSLAIHGRTRACKFGGFAEYDTIAEVAQSVSIPVFANGDITNAKKAADILDYTGAAGVMIGRAAQGYPWIFSEINDLIGETHVNCGLFNAKSLNLGNANGFSQLILKHLQLIEQFDNNLLDSQPLQIPPKRRSTPSIARGVKIARKHVCWYFDHIERMMIDQLCNDQNYSNNTKKTVARAAIKAARSRFNQLGSYQLQREFIDSFFRDIKSIGDLAA